MPSAQGVLFPLRKGGRKELEKLRKIVRGFETLFYAIRGMCRQPERNRKLIELGIFAAAAFCLTQIFAVRMEASLWTVLAFLLRWSWIPALMLFLALRHGEPLKRRRFEKFFGQVGLCGYDGKLPRYLGSEPVNQYVEVLRFRSLVPESVWLSKKEEISMHLLKKILKIKTAKDHLNTIEIFVIKQELERYLPWDDSYMEDGDVFAIGEGYGGKVVWCADSLHHGVVAGATSQGKTSLLRLLVYQAAKKRWNISIIDMKGGGDYAAFADIERGYGPIMETNAKRVQELLLMLTNEVRYRLERFEEVGVVNIQQYNARNQDQFLSWLLIIDEAAELLDVRPKDKEEKQMYAEIEGYLRTLARTSRAAGVHLVFGYIRPSSDVLDGQIKNNLLWRVCGYFADNAASHIVLDNDKATKLPPDVKGRFIIGEDEVQTYYLEP